MNCDECVSDAEPTPVCIMAGIYNGLIYIARNLSAGLNCEMVRLAKAFGNELTHV